MLTPIIDRASACVTCASRWPLRSGQRTSDIADVWACGWWSVPVQLRPCANAHTHACSHADCPRWTVSVPARKSHRPLRNTEPQTLGSGGLPWHNRCASRLGALLLQLCDRPRLECTVAVADPNASATFWPALGRRILDWYSFPLWPLRRVRSHLCGAASDWAVRFIILTAVALGSALAWKEDSSLNQAQSATQGTQGRGGQPRPWPGVACGCGRVRCRAEAGERAVCRVRAGRGRGEGGGRGAHLRMPMACPARRWRR